MKKTPSKKTGRASKKKTRAKPDGIGVKVAPRQPPSAVLDPVGPPALSAKDKQARFVAEYLVDLNGAAAARRAGYSDVRPDQQAYELLRKPEIAAAIAAGKARQMASADLSAVRVLEELRRLAFSNQRDYWNADGSAKHPHQLTDEQGACLAGFEVVIKNVAAGDGVQDTIHKFKLWNKPAALEMLAKHFELLVERVKVDTTSADQRIARLMATLKRTAK